MYSYTHILSLIYLPLYIYINIYNTTYIIYFINKRATLVERVTQVYI